MVAVACDACMLSSVQLSDADRAATSNADFAVGTDRIAGARRSAAREDIMYYWGLAETYLSDPVMLAAMRWETCHPS